MENDLKTLIEAPIPTDNKDIADLYRGLRDKSRSLIDLNSLVANYVVDLLNQIIRNSFCPQMQDMLKQRGLYLEGYPYNSDCDWVISPWAGFTIINDNWKHFLIGIEFGSKWLKKPIIGFLKKDDVKRETMEPLWTNLQNLYKMKKNLNNELWIYKQFIGNNDWHTDDAINKIMDGTMVNQFAEMIDEILDVAEQVKNINPNYEL